MRHINKGFTLIELLTTVVVASIVLAIALPSFKDQANNTRALAMGEEFSTALNFARSEALKRSKRVTVCASADSLTCSADWTKGYIVFVDYAAADNVAPVVQPDISVGLPIILRKSAASVPDAVVSIKYGADDYDYVRFNGQGGLARITVPPAAITADFSIEGCKGDNVRRVTVSVTGMVSVARQNCP